MTPTWRNLLCAMWLCLSLTQAFAGEPPARSRAWSDFLLPGTSLTLIDDRRAETLEFRDGGLVTATIGAKEGPLAGPVFFWKVSGDRLTVTDDPERPAVYDVFTLRSRKADEVVVLRRSGETARFRVARASR